MVEYVMVRIPQDLIEELRKEFPELAGEGNAYLVRTALRKLLAERHKSAKD